MERQEKSYDAPETGKEKISTKDLFGFLAWHDDPTTSSREKKLLKKTIDAALDERREVVEKEFEKMVADDPALRAAFGSLPAEMTAAAPQAEIAELANELRKSPAQFERYLIWLGDILNTIDPKKILSEDSENIRNELLAIKKAGHTESLNIREILAIKVFFIRQMKRRLRHYGIAADALTDEAFRTWLQSKKIR